MKKIINRLIEHEILNKKESKEILYNIANGQYNNSQISAFLTVYMMRSISVIELEGFRDALLDLCININLDEFDPIDLCGTGGDNKDTFNISTLASFVTAGSGISVAKHGNYGVSSNCGSSNVMEYLGIKFSNDEGFLKKCMEKAGICILHAPLFHPAMKNVAPIRKELAVKTFFNMLGPMVNPSFPKNQIVGVQKEYIDHNHPNYVSAKALYSLRKVFKHCVKTTDDDDKRCATGFRYHKWDLGQIDDQCVYIHPTMTWFNISMIASFQELYNLYIYFIEL